MRSMCSKWEVVQVVRSCSGVLLQLGSTSHWSCADPSLGAASVWACGLVTHCIFCKLRRGQQERERIHLKITSFVPILNGRLLFFSHPSLKCKGFPFLRAVARLKRRCSLQPSPSKGRYCSSPTCCWRGKKRLCLQPTYQTALTFDCLIYLLACSAIAAFSRAAFFVVLVFVVFYVDSKLFRAGSVSYLSCKALSKFTHNLSAWYEQPESFVFPSNWFQ